jgi:hypothetical protein
MTEIELYEILRSKLGDKEAKTLVEYVDTKIEKKLEQKKDELATKLDLANTKAELELKIEQIKSDIIKWMFLFWIGQLASLIAILQIFFKS